MQVPYYHRGPGTNYNAFGELRGPARTQDQIRAYLAEGEALAMRRAGGQATPPEVTQLRSEAAPQVGATVLSAQELHGAGPAAEQAVVSVPDVIAQVALPAQVEVA